MQLKCFKIVGSPASPRDPVRRYDASTGQELDQDSKRKD